MRSIFMKPKAGWKITARKWFPIAELPYKIGINIPIIQKGQTGSIKDRQVLLSF